jgi:plastocyanin
MNLQRASPVVLMACFAVPLVASGPVEPSSTIPACAPSAACPPTSTQELTGNVTIKKKLTRPNVTASVSIYQRGTAVELGKDAAEDPIAYERSRVVIYLEGPSLPASTAAAHPATTTMQQLNRRFTPDLLVVPAGTTVSFPNLDPIFHNIFSLSKPKSFDLGNYDKGETRNVTFSKPGIVYVYCHLHPNMEATIVVTPNRWYAHVDPSGQFRIPSVPPGQYTVVAWHKAAGFFSKTIQVEPGHNASVDFFIPIGDAPSQTSASSAKADTMDGMDGK